MTETTVNLQKNKTALIWVWLSLGVVLLDQFSKFLILQCLSFQSTVRVLPFFQLVHWPNQGAAFGLLHSAGDFALWLFAIIAGVISVVILVWLSKLPRSARWQGVALGLVLGGALGNLVDRIWHGYVVDFLFFAWHGYSFPAFNMADSAITVGAAFLILQALRNR